MKNILALITISFALHTGVQAQQDSLLIEQIFELQGQVDSLEIMHENYGNEIEEIGAEAESNKRVLTVYKRELDSMRVAINEYSAEIQVALNGIGNNSVGLSNLRKETGSLRQLIEEQRELITDYNESWKAKAEELSGLIDETDKEANEKIAGLDNSLSQSTTYWIIAVLLTFLVAIGLFFALKRKVESGTDDLINKITSTKKDLEEEGLKLDQKLIDILGSQLKLLKEKGDIQISASGEPDHSLALKTADEVTRIRMNLDHMDSKIKGWKQLDRSARAILNNFKANGYGLPELLGKDYDDKMNMIANIEIDDSLAMGEKKIKRVIKPQVEYKGKVIQAAEVVVGIGN